MATKIPFDQGLALGNILLPERVEALQKIAEAQKPVELLNDQLNALTMQNYKIRMLYNQLVNMGVSQQALTKVEANGRKLKKDMIQTAIKLARATIKSESDVVALKLADKQTTITTNVESPINYGLSQVQNFPLSFDSIKFDVQYHRNEMNVDEQEAHANSVTNSVGSTLKTLGTTIQASTAHAVNKNTLKQTSHHTIEGTIVICAHCTHKQADIIDPFIIDPVKAVSAWNYMFPKDQLRVDPSSIIEAALPANDSDPEKENAINLLSGCTKGSCFIGFVHILQTEETTTSQVSESVASAMQLSIETDLAVASFTGNIGSNSSTGKTAKSLMSSSQLSTQCSIVCEGSIPNIATEKVTTATMNMKPDPQEIMGNLSAIMGASDSAVNSSMESQTEDAKNAVKFNKLNGEHLQNTVTNLTKVEEEDNQVLNTNSMLTAFSDFCKEAVSGKGGVPINFFVKRLTKSDVAKEYIGKFYPNGASGKQALRGQLGQEELKEGEGET